MRRSEENPVSQGETSAAPFTERPVKALTAHHGARVPVEPRRGAERTSRRTQAAAGGTGALRPTILCWVCRFHRRFAKPASFPKRQSALVGRLGHAFPALVLSRHPFVDIAA